MRSLLALSDVPDPAALPLILGGAGDRTWGVRANVPIALRRYRMAFGEAVVRDSGALPVLHRLLHDGHRKVAAQSALALRVFADLEPVRDAADGRPWIAEVLTSEIHPLPAFGAGEPGETLP